jgi:hypothetical protein
VVFAGAGVVVVVSLVVSLVPQPGVPHSFADMSSVVTAAALPQPGASSVGTDSWLSLARWPFVAAWIEEPRPRPPRARSLPRAPRLPRPPSARPPRAGLLLPGASFRPEGAPAGFVLAVFLGFDTSPHCEMLPVEEGGGSG